MRQPLGDTAMSDHSIRRVGILMPTRRAGPRHSANAFQRTSRLDLTTPFSVAGFPASRSDLRQQLTVSGLRSVYGEPSGARAGSRLSNLGR